MKWIIEKYKISKFLFLPVAGAVLEGAGFKLLPCVSLAG